MAGALPKLVLFAFVAAKIVPGRLALFEWHNGQGMGVVPVRTILELTIFEDKQHALAWGLRAVHLRGAVRLHFATKEEREAIYLMVRAAMLEVEPADAEEVRRYVEGEIELKRSEWTRDMLALRTQVERALAELPARKQELGSEALAVRGLREALAELPHAARRTAPASKPFDAEARAERQTEEVRRYVEGEIELKRSELTRYMLALRTQVERALAELSARKQELGSEALTVRDLREALAELPHAARRTAPASKPFDAEARAERQTDAQTMVAEAHEDFMRRCAEKGGTAPHLAAPAGPESEIERAVRLQAATQAAEWQGRLKTQWGGEEETAEWQRRMMAGAEEEMQ